jgi:hypothetical protein
MAAVVIGAMVDGALARLVVVTSGGLGRERPGLGHRFIDRLDVGGTGRFLPVDDALLLRMVSEPWRSPLCVLDDDIVHLLDLRLPFENAASEDALRTSLPACHPAMAASAHDNFSEAEPFAALRVRA